MNETLQFLLHHGYAVLFVWVFAEQLGVPVPSIPLLLAMGALAARGRFSFWVSLGLAVAAALASDSIWYELGRRRGHSILNLLCRISLEPDSCVRNTENLFTRYGARALLVAKFVPGLGMVTSPLAGMFNLRRRRFLAWDAAGAFLWAGAFSGAGFVFRAQIERLAAYGARLGSWFLVLLVGALAAYLAWKYLERRRFIRNLRVARITPEELRQKLEAGEDIVVVDLRHSMEFEADESRIPGSLHLLPEELETRNHEIPRDRDIVLYCT